MYENIFTLMKENRMTQRELAEILGIPPSILSDWKSGRVKPSIEHMKALSQHFNVSIDYLVGKTSDPAPVQFDSAGHPVNVPESIPGLYLNLARGAQKKGLSERDVKHILELIERFK